jgi:hypothetical protein
VELAIAMPILLLFTIAALDIGRVFYTYVDITNAARQGARLATLPEPGCDEVSIQELVGNDDLHLESCANDRRTVSIEHTFEPLFIGDFLGYVGHPIQLSASATMPVVTQ